MANINGKSRTLAVRTPHFVSNWILQRAKKKKTTVSAVVISILIAAFVADSRGKNDQ